jgi:hypothetical protein
MTMIICPGVQLERDHALLDVQDVILLYGYELINYNRDEDMVVRDRYNSIKSRTRTEANTLAIRAYPITPQPNRLQIEKAGLREDCELLAYTAMKDWTDNSLTFELIEPIRLEFTFRNQKYIGKEKALFSQFSDTFLYITFGLKKM